MVSSTKRGACVCTHVPKHPSHSRIKTHLNVWKPVDEFKPQAKKSNEILMRAM